MNNKSNTKPFTHKTLKTLSPNKFMALYNTRNAVHTQLARLLSAISTVFSPSLSLHSFWNTRQHFSPIRLTLIMNKCRFINLFFPSIDHAISFFRYPKSGTYLYLYLGVLLSVTVCFSVSFDGNVTQRMQNVALTREGVIPQMPEREKKSKSEWERERELAQFTNLKVI